MEEVEKIKEYLKDLILVMANRAEKEVDALMPGYTHVQVRTRCRKGHFPAKLTFIRQRAQPVRWSHLLLSHAHAFYADLNRLAQLIPRISILPLGCAALAGNPYSIDREFLREQLGFDSLGENSMYIVPDRDFVIEFLQWSSLMMIHMSKMAEDFIIYSTAEFGFIQLSDAYRCVLCALGDNGGSSYRNQIALDRLSCLRRRIP
jgi:argininosuccinate lyase